MSQNGVVERRLTELLPAQRNLFYYGKLMDVRHFSMEQQYVLSKQWLFNRTVLGSGVVFGLGVEPLNNQSGQGVLIRSGLAIDGWGREIIVPNDVPLVPLALTDQCGSPQPGALTPQVKIQICYNECSTDFSPSLVSDPDCGCGGCEAGTVVESYCLKVLTGAGDPVTLPCLDVVKKGLDAGDVHAVFCALSKSSPPDPDDPCLTLANLTVGRDGTLTIDDCTPRAIAPTNLMLAQLISCLAECCHTKGTPMQVIGVSVKSTQADPKNPSKPDDPTLQPVPGGVLSLPSGITVKPIPTPDLVEFTLSSPPALDPKTLTLATKGGPPPSVAVSQPTPRDKIFHMGGNVFRVYRPGGFRGNAVIRLEGGTDVAGAQPNTISATDGTRLDGENPAAYGPGWHSGEGTQGGEFAVELHTGL